MSDASPTTLTFLGDVACPRNVSPTIVGIEPLPFGAAVVNLEGALCSAAEMPRRALYNAEHVLPLLRRWTVRVASLANNHILDVGLRPSDVVARLAEVGIQAVGAGDRLAEAQQPAILQLDGQKLVFLAFNWDVVRGRSAGPSRPGPNPLVARAVLSAIQEQRAHDARAIIVPLVHWGYEFERYPIPAQRQLAFAMIEAGAATVIGHHPHCVQGIEWHQGCPIAYSLGNWFIPQGEVFGRKIHYPEYCSLQLALEWKPNTEHATCHWFQYERATHNIAYLTSEDATSSPRLQELTPFAGLSHSQYVDWFINHRTRRKGLPVYRDYREIIRNRALDWYCANRSWLARRFAVWRGR